MSLNKKREDFLEFSKKFVGTPYKYGARMSDAPDSFDCSGFIKYIFEKFDYKMPRSTIEQAEFAGKKVDNLNDLEIGDLIFLHGERGHYNKTFPKGIGHVVMYIGDGKVLHASSRRIHDYPNIVEDGQVRINELTEAVDNSGPVIVIKRIIKD